MNARSNRKTRLALALNAVAVTFVILAVAPSAGMVHALERSFPELPARGGAPAEEESAPESAGQKSESATETVKSAIPSTLAARRARVHHVLPCTVQADRAASVHEHPSCRDAASRPDSVRCDLRNGIGGPLLC